MQLSLYSAIVGICLQFNINSNPNIPGAIIIGLLTIIAVIYSFYCKIFIIILISLIYQTLQWFCSVFGTRYLLTLFGLDKETDQYCWLLIILPSSINLFFGFVTIINHRILDGHWQHSLGPKWYPDIIHQIIFEIWLGNVFIILMSFVYEEKLFNVSKKDVSVAIQTRNKFAKILNDQGFTIRIPV